MRRELDDLDIDMKHYLNKFRKNTNDSEAAIEVCKLLIGGDFEVKRILSNKQINFYPKSQYESKCYKCQGKYNVGDSVFLHQKKAWHLTCATEEEKTNCLMYQNWIKKQVNSAPQLVLIKTEIEEVDDDTNGFQDKVRL